MRNRSPGAPTPLDMIARPEGSGSGGGSYSGGALGPAPGGGGAGGYSGPRITAPAPGTLPPDYFPSGPSATYFALLPPPGQTQPFQSVTGPAAGVVLATAQLPQGAMGVLRDLTVSVAPMLATDRIAFRVEIDGAPVAGWGIQMVPRPAAYASASFLPDLTRILIPAGSRVEVVADRTDANTSELGVNARGWHFPAGLYDRFYRDI